jgi:amicoumacin kinase
MEPRLAALFNDEILADGLRAWGFHRPAERVGAAENFVYRAQGPDGPAILRFAHSSRRPPELVAGEMDWLERLGSRGMAVHRAIRSRAGLTHESLAAADGSAWVVSAFTLARGEVAHRVSTRRLDYAAAWGRALGEMQAEAAACARDGLTFARPAFDQPPSRESSGQVAPSHPEIAAAHEAALAPVTALPRPAHLFGLVHTDLHEGNFFVDEANAVTCIDFDDCAYHYFLQDLTIPIYYALLHEPLETLQLAAERIFKKFLSGYLTAFELPEDELERVPLFLRLRDVELMQLVQLWQVPAEHRFAVAVSRQYREGHPGRRFPWRRWYCEAREGV